MAEKDLKEKVLEDYNDVFADIYNTLVFEGNYLREDGLSDGATTSIYKTEIGEPAEQFRDVLKTYVEDYKIRVYDIAFLSDNVIEKFTSDFKIVARFFKDRRLKQNTLMKDETTKIRHAEAVLDLFSVFTKDNSYRNLYTKAIKEKEENGEEIDMCWIAQSLIAEGRSEGIEKGLAACVQAFKSTGSTFEKIYKAVTSTETYAHVTEEQVRAYYEGRD